MKKTKQPTETLTLMEVKVQADRYLAEIQTRTAEIKRMSEEAEAQIESIRTNFRERLQAEEILLSSAETCLKQVMKMNRKVLFTGTDIVYLHCGELVYSLTHPVAFPRIHVPLIALLEAKGLKDVVKVKKSLDADAIEKWDEDQLAVVGLTRKNVEEFKYNLKKESISYDLKKDGVSKG